MHMHRCTGWLLASAVALAMTGVAASAAAQTTTPTRPQAPTTAPAAPSSGFERGTETSATYPLPDGQHGTVTIRAGMPAHVTQYGPPPAFATLDANHDGRISATEAAAYPPLDGDFLHASGGAKTISRTQYQAWVQSPD